MPFKFDLLADYVEVICTTATSPCDNSQIRSEKIRSTWTVSITTLFYLVYIEPGPTSRQKRQEDATVIETRSSIPEQYPTANDLRQYGGIAPNYSLCIDSAIRTTLTDPDSYKFISATLWTQDFAGHGPKAWICQAEYHSSALSLTVV
jgi:DNA-directed RNA polymerase